MDSFQERKHKNFQVESDPFFGHLCNQTFIGLTKPGRHFGLGASRHMKKHLSLQLNSRPIRPGIRSALFWTVFRSANTKIFRLNPTQLKRGVLPASGLMCIRDVGNAAYTAMTTDTCNQVAMQSSLQ